MYFTAAVLQPPAGLNQIPPSSNALVVSETETKVQKSGTQTKHALTLTNAILYIGDVWKYREEVLAVVLPPSQGFLEGVEFQTTSVSHNCLADILILVSVSHNYS